MVTEYIMNNSIISSQTHFATQLSSLRTRSEQQSSAESNTQQSTSLSSSDSTKHTSSNGLKTSSSATNSFINNSLQAQEFNGKEFRGKDHIFLMDPSDKASRIESVLSRFSPEQQEALIDSGLILDDDFLSLTEKLNDEELGQLANVVEALQTSPKLNNFPPQMISSQFTAEKFISSLEAMDDKTRSRVLEKASAYASQVPRQSEEQTYDQSGTISATQGSASANDLYNFVNAVSKSEDVGLMLDKLEMFDPEQQSDLLQIMGSHIQLGDRLIDQLVERDTASRSATLSFLAGLVESVSPYIQDAKTSVSPGGSGSSSTNNNAFVKLDHDNNSGTTVFDMLEETVALLENYTLNDEQLEKMASELNGLDRSGQRAYLAITTTGIEQIFGKEPGNQIDLTDQEEALDVITNLSNNSVVRDLVFQSRMGEERLIDGERFYQLKEEGDSQRDQTLTISLLVSNAWMNQAQNGESPHSGRLANNLLQLNSDQRDELVSNLNSLVRNEIPLTQLSEEALQEQYQALFNRTSSLTDTNDIDALLQAESDTPASQRENFWEATAIAGAEVDKLIGALDGHPPEIREQIIQELSSLAQQRNLNENVNNQTVNPKSLASNPEPNADQLDKQILKQASQLIDFYWQNRTNKE